MTERDKLSQMLEHLINDNNEQAEELFHEYIVAKSREIYENLVEAEMDQKDDDEDEDEDVEESMEDLSLEADDDAIGGDETDDLEADLDAEMDDEGGDDEEDMGEKEPEELFQDLDAIVDELQAKFDSMQGGDEGDMDDMDDEMKDDFDLDTVREYVEKVPAGHGAEKKGTAEQADNVKSTIDNMKNDMGGTTANIVSGGEEKGGDHAGLSQTKAKEENAGNINVPGGKAGGAFSKKEPGHGAEKKGSAESADNKQSLFRGRR